MYFLHHWPIYLYNIYILANVSACYYGIYTYEPQCVTHASYACTFGVCLKGAHKDEEDKSNNQQSAKPINKWRNTPRPSNGRPTLFKSIKLIPWEDITWSTRDYLGSGSNSTGVYRATVDVAGMQKMECVVKIFKARQEEPPLSEGKGLMMAHPAILQALFMTSEAPWGLVFPYMNRGTLQDFNPKNELYLRSPTHDKELNLLYKRAKPLTKLLVGALRALHAEDMLHADLHSSNVLVNVDLDNVLTICLSDLGRAKKAGSCIVTPKVGMTQHPPEYAKVGAAYTKAGDVYALCKVIRKYIFTGVYRLQHKDVSALDVVFRLLEKGVSNTPSTRPSIQLLCDALQR